MLVRTLVPVVLAATFAVASAPTLRAQETADYSPAQWPRVTPVVDVVRQVGPAVVNIYQEVVSEEPLPWPYNRMFPQRRLSTSLGSGVIIDADGFILTNAHVIQPGGEIQVQLSDGTSQLASLVNLDATNDVALLKIHPQVDLPVAELGTSSDVMVGETVLAIGNPLGNASSVTTGIVSSVFRDVRLPDGAGERFRDFIQLDAPINPGNSGGPLLNIRGDVIGINWAIAKEAEGIGFAIPIDRVRQSLVDTLLNPQLHKNVVTGMELSSDARGRDVSVAMVNPDSPASRAGLEPGDRVVSVGGAAVDWVFDVAKAFYQADPGDDVAIVVDRGGEQVPTSLRLAEEMSPLKFISDTLGLRVVDHPNYFGVLVEAVDPGGPAARLPLRRGDLIDGFEDQKVDGIQDLYGALRRAGSTDPVTLNLFRGGKALRGRLSLR
jgi:serine protease Do